MEMILIKLTWLWGSIAWKWSWLSWPECECMWRDRVIMIKLTWMWVCTGIGLSWSSWPECECVLGGGVHLSAPFGFPCLGVPVDLQLLRARIVIFCCSLLLSKKTRYTFRSYGWDLDLLAVDWGRVRTQYFFTIPTRIFYSINASFTEVGTRSIS